MQRLFDSIAGGRPEHVAKGALAHILRRSRSLQAWLSERVSADTVEVDEIVTEYEDRWVVDIAVFWKGPSARKTFLELKLGAPYTVLQRKVRESMIVVAPRGTRSSDGLADLINLEDMLDRALDDFPTDDSIGPACFLLREACQAFGWYREEISRATLLREARAIFDESGPQRTWAELYRFFNQIHLHLQDGALEHGLRYNSDDRMKPAIKARYYGYYLGFGGPKTGRIAKPWWIGLEYPDAASATFRFYDSEDGWMDHFGPGDAVLRASSIAKSILDRALKSCL